MRAIVCKFALTCWILAGGLLASARSQGEEPGNGVNPCEVISEMLQSRRGIRTAYVEWQRVRPQAVDARMRRMICRVGGTDALHMDLGPVDGPRWLLDKGQIPPPDLGPQSSLTKSGLLWLHDELATDATVYESENAGRAPRTADLRAFGIAPGDFGLEDVGKQLLHYCAQPGAAAMMQGDMALVSFGDGHQKMTVQIDTARDFNPTQIEVADPTGRVQGLLKSTLKKYGDRWFPESVTHEMSGPGGLLISQIIRITRAEFNEPDLPTELALQDIGIDVGTLVTRKDATGKQIDQRYWDGREIVAVAEFRKRSTDGSLPLPAARREEWLKSRVRTGISAPAPARAEKTDTPIVPDWAADALGDWEKQTIVYIHQHKLKSQQVDAAVRFLQQAQACAYEYLGRAAEDPRPASAPPPTTNAGDKPPHAAQERVLERLNRIRDRELKSRLDTLLPLAASKPRAG